MLMLCPIKGGTSAFISIDRAHSPLAQELLGESLSDALPGLSGAQAAVKLYPAVMAMCGTGAGEPLAGLRGEVDQIMMASLIEPQAVWELIG